MQAGTWAGARLKQGPTAQAPPAPDVVIAVYQDDALRTGPTEAPAGPLPLRRVLDAAAPRRPSLHVRRRSSA